MRVPALVDHSNRDLILVETGAVVMYLVERYGQVSSRGRGDIGRSGQLCPQDEEGKVLARQWLFFGLTGTCHIGLGIELGNQELTSARAHRLLPRLHNRNSLSL